MLLWRYLLTLLYHGSTYHGSTYYGSTYCGRLVLISPAGVPHAPRDFDPKGKSGTPLTPTPSPTRTLTEPQPGPQPEPELQTEPYPGNRDKPLLFQLAFSLWERGYSPLSMVRTAA